MPTMGLDGHYGCPYTYDKGYRLLAEWLASPFGETSTAPTSPHTADPPNPARAIWNEAAHTSVRISLADPAQRLRCDAGTQPDFTLYGTEAKEAQVSSGTQYLVLALAGPGTGLTGITYFGRTGTAGLTTTPVTPWITNESGVGLRACDRLPITALRSRYVRRTGERPVPLCGVQVFSCALDHQERLADASGTVISTPSARTPTQDGVRAEASPCAAGYAWAGDAGWWGPH